MNFDIGFYDSFRSRFEEKEPARQHLRRVTKLDLFLSVRDIVEQHRIKGYGWEGIAAIFRDLGVPISASTLRACATRAREKETGATPAGSKRVRRGHGARRPPRRAHTSEPASPSDQAPSLPIESALTVLHGPSDSTAPGSRKEDAQTSPRRLAPLGDDGASREPSPASRVREDHADATGIATMDGDSAVGDAANAEAIPALEPTTPGLTSGVNSSSREAAAGSTRTARRMAFQPQRDDEEL